MSGCYIFVCLFAVFARELLGVTVQTGLYSRVELTGELDQQTVDTLKEVEWKNLKKTSTCLCLKFFKQNGSAIVYSKCCGTAHFYLNNNSLILENVTSQVEGVFKEIIISNNSTTKSFNFTLNIVYPPNATGIVVSWSSDNTSVSLTCDVSGTFTDIMWKRENSPILKDNRHSFSENNKTLHIRNITSSDYGTYGCVAINLYGKSETQTYITSEDCSTHKNTTLYPELGANSQRQTMQILLLSGVTFIGILGLCIIGFCGINKYRHSHVHRRTQDGNTRGHRGDDRTTEEDVDTGLALYQEVGLPGTEVVSPLPYVYTDFIKPREANQNSSAAENTEDFGYSEIGPAVKEKVISDRSSTDEQSTPCPNTVEK